MNDEEKAENWSNEKSVPIPVPIPNLCQK
jgi:hypothetical protein